jgi:hypothetical protein
MQTTAILLYYELVLSAIVVLSIVCADRTEVQPVLLSNITGTMPVCKTLSQPLYSEYYPGSYSTTVLQFICIQYEYSGSTAVI